MLPTSCITNVPVPGATTVPAAAKAASMTTLSAAQATRCAQRERTCCGASSSASFSPTGAAALLGASALALFAVADACALGGARQKLEATMTAPSTATMAALPMSAVVTIERFVQSIDYRACPHRAQSLAQVLPE